VTAFASLKIVGGLLPSDLLDRVFAGDPQVPGTSPETYALERGESVRRQASRSWLYLLEVWQEFQRRLADVGDGLGAADARSARVTRERWLHILLRELGFRHVTAESGFEIDGKSFPVSHRAGHVPIHLLGWDTDLDHKTSKVTARAPQSMLQELLNRDDSCLWAILSNGTTLRILRDSTALVGSFYVELDLQAIFDGELFSDFVLLYLVCHESRFASVGDGGPETCYLEQWRGFAAEQGERALDQLRGGVQQAIAILGTGFLSHPDNTQLRIRLDPRNAELKLEDLNRALLRVVYRILFWFVAEDRGALLIADSEEQDAGSRARLREARDRYTAYFSSARLRQIAHRHRGGRHPDLWEAVQLVFDGLAAEGGIPELALPGLGGIFESKRHDGQALPLDEPLTGARLSNEALLDAVRALSVIRSRSGGGMRRVDFGNLGAEELGSVYESLLEFIPHYDAEQRSYTLDTLPGNERKETGSYYTPTSLVECLLDSALDPLLDKACNASTPEERVAALLDITVCDPACGSGHFLVAAARRIAKRIASEETGEPEPPEVVIRAALRRVAGRCIYGVDINPMAAELAKVSLWLEALEPGKPLSFLDQNIRVGNSLLGVTPALLAQGLPEAAFKPLQGDDRKVVAALKKQNATEHAGQRDMFSPGGILVSNAVLAQRTVEITRAVPDSLEDLHIHQQRLAQQLAGSKELREAKLAADAWCAAFVQPRNERTRTTAITQAVLERLASGEQTLELAQAEEDIERIARQYRFFHWHIEFPHVFRTGDGAHDVDPQTGWEGGFICVIGNPPWEKVEVKEEEFFAAPRPDIANAPNAAARKKMIEKLDSSENEADRALYQQFQDELRKSGGWAHLLRDSARYPLTGRGRLNTYALFAETAQTVINTRGRSGLVVPTGIATDHTTSLFFRDLVAHRRLDSLFDFVTNPQFWQEIGHGRMRFSLLTMTGHSTTVSEPEFATLVKHPNELPSRGHRIRIQTEEILLLNPNTGTCPMFKIRRDAEITVDIYKRLPVLWRDHPEDNPWGLLFMQGLFNMASDSGLFHMREDLERAGWWLTGNIFTRGHEQMLPLYEAKLIHHFDHRLACYSKRAPGSQDTELPRLSAEEKANPSRVPIPRYWVAAEKVEERLAGRWDLDWLLGWRDIARSTDDRTMICSMMPRTAVGHKLPLALPTQDADLLCACWSSFVFDYVTRQKMTGTSVAFFILKQLPVPRPDEFAAPAPWSGDRVLGAWIRARVLELSYTAYDMTPFAEDLGDDGLPFRWDEDRRAAMRAELDAAYFHMYGIDRDDVDYIMETFPIVKRKDFERYGSFRTKELILQVYDTMTEATRAGVPYQTILDPPPGNGARHPAR
jgi:hypothetical protein